MRHHRNIVVATAPRKRRRESDGIIVAAGISLLAANEWVGSLP
jgi:hypothetical protein